MLCNEKDYLEVIDKEDENKRLDTHWKKCAAKKEWIQVDGKKIKFDEIENSHLINIIGMLNRFLEERYSTNLLNLILVFSKELLTRFENFKCLYDEKEKENENE